MEREAYEESLECVLDVDTRRARMAKRKQSVVELRGCYEAGFQKKKRAFLLILPEQTVGIGDAEAVEGVDGVSALKVDDDSAEVEDYVFDVVHLQKNRMLTQN